MNMQMKQTRQPGTRREVDVVHVDHAVMPVELAVAGSDVEIRTGKSGSQTQMLMDDLAVILSAVLDAGIDAADLMERFGAVDARDAPVTRNILQAIADMQEGQP